MELQYEKNTLRALAESVGDVRSTELTQEIKLPDGMPDIGRVLTGWGQPVIRSKEWSRDEILLSGGVTVWTLYVPEDGTEVRSMETWLPFQMKWDVPQDIPEGVIRVAPRIRFVDSRGISARKMMLRAGISVQMQAFNCRETELFTPLDAGADVELLRRCYPVRVPVEAGERTFHLDEELNLPENVPDAEKILCAVLCPEVTDRKVLDDKLLFKGHGNLHLIYRCSEGNVRVWDHDVPFSQFAELDGSYAPDAGADICLAVTDMDTDLAEPGTIRLKAGLVGQYLVDERKMLELTEDAYSPFREVEPVMGKLKTPAILEDISERIDVRQSISGQEGQCVDVWMYADYPRIRRHGGDVELEIPGVFQMLYYAPDESLRAASMRWEGRVQMHADENVTIRTRIPACVKVEGTRTAEGIALSGQMPLQIRTTSDTDFPMVTGLSIGDIRQEEEIRPSVVLRRMGEGGLWELAKSCGSTVAAILSANDLQSEPVDNRILLIPVV